VRINGVYREIALAGDGGDDQVRQGKPVSGRRKLPTECGRSAPFVPLDLQPSELFHAGGSPFSLFRSPEAVKHFREDGPDDDDAILLDESIDRLPVIGFGL